ncbi:uncharacterized protein LOC115033405 [Acyrthosiphon pisum]|uniref:Uncharacterized protein n=1 Tax=Acyrthosiphon pisum TaxID=7029 RepID=A0A8R2NNB5_ACYPI|nr:uncharacterized protein LOC115033405 [Acyrthosiphon pisum]
MNLHKVKISPGVAFFLKMYQSKNFKFLVITCNNFLFVTSRRFNDHLSFKQQESRSQNALYIASSTTVFLLTFFVFDKVVIGYRGSSGIVPAPSISQFQSSETNKIKST